MISELIQVEKPNYTENISHFTIKEPWILSEGLRIIARFLYDCKKATSKSLTRAELMIFIEPLMGDKVVILRKISKAYDGLCD